MPTLSISLSPSLAFPLSPYIPLSASLSLSAASDCVLAPVLLRARGGGAAKPAGVDGGRRCRDNRGTRRQSCTWDFGNAACIIKLIFDTLLERFRLDEDGVIVQDEGGERRIEAQTEE